MFGGKTPQVVVNKFGYTKGLNFLIISVYCFSGRKGPFMNYIWWPKPCVGWDRVAMNIMFRKGRGK